MLDRDDYWQCAYVIPKGGYELVRQRGMDAFRQAIARIAPFLDGRVQELRGGTTSGYSRSRSIGCGNGIGRKLLCIGDAAHAMSPIGGVGINLAVQDAVATANILAGPLRDGRVTLADLRKLQRRRQLPTRLTQRLQVLIQNRVITRVLASDAPLSVPWPLKLLRRFPILRRIPARVIGIGFRPEHVKTPDAFGGR